MEQSTGKMHYCVLYTPVLAQDRLRKLLKEQMPEGRGTVFCPCMETYRRGAEGGTLKLKAIFPGYIFIRSDLKAAELHDFIRGHRKVFMSYIRELKRSERMAAQDVLPENEDAGYEYTVSDLNDDEAAFLDFLLNIDDSGGEVDEDVRIALKKEAKTASGEQVPTEGLLRMSYGYKERGRNGKKDCWRVVKGPLRAYEDHIADVNVHDKKAYLDFSVGERVVRAGFDVRPKREFFPDDDSAPEVLSDGTEVDINEIMRCMMRI